MMPLNLSLGSFPGVGFLNAMTAAKDLDGISMSHVQLCPQNSGAVDHALDALIERHPATQFRLHANVRITGHQRGFHACSVGAEADAYFNAVAGISHALGADVYSLHAGEGEGRPLADLKRRLHQLEDMMGMVVAVEGHYPDRHAKWWLSSWEDYRWLLDSGLHYALDLSHLHIVAHHTRRVEQGLVAELLASEKCKEVHVSYNDGISDLHAKQAVSQQWWQPILECSSTQAVIFYEGNEVRGPQADSRIKERMSIASRRELAIS